MMRKLLLSLISLFILVSCSDSEYIDFLSGNSTDHICFQNHTMQSRTYYSEINPIDTSYVPLYDSNNNLNTEYGIYSYSSDIDRGQSFVSRGYPVYNIDSIRDIKVSACYYNGDWADLNSVSWYIDNVIFHREDDNQCWNSQKQYFWNKEEENIRFFMTTSVNSVISLFNDKYPYFKYVTPAKVEDQKDLLFSDPIDKAGNYRKTVDCTLKHMLSQISFSFADSSDSATINKIELDNIYSTGQFFFDKDVTTNSNWKNIATLKNYSVDYGDGMAFIPNGEDLLITKKDSSKAFMMIPQTLNKDAKIVIYLTDQSNKKRTLTANIGGEKWEMGKNINYKLYYSKYKNTLQVVAPLDFSYSGSSTTYTIDSYETNTVDGSKKAIKWKEYISEDNGLTWKEEKPSWISTMKLSGSGNAKTPETMTITAKAQTGTLISPEDDYLKNASAVSDFDLSYQDGKINTANCYVVNSPGSYIFPLVYGNGIKNSATNSASYKCNSSMSKILKTFINHKGVGIESPIIEENDINVTSAQVLWQGSKTLTIIDNDVAIINKSIVIDGIKKNVKFLKFNISRENIQQGNALIAAKDDNGDVVWSWHIWITDWNKDNSVSMSDGTHTYEMMPFNIGYVAAQTTHYDERSILVKICQTEGINPKDTTICIKQASRNYIVARSAYYHWGRKDPFYAYKGYESYTPVGNSCDKMEESILYPANYYSPLGAYGGWHKKIYYNYWNNDPKDDAQGVNYDVGIKTVFDPSPVGYMVPCNGLFTLLSTDGKSHTCKGFSSGIDNGYLSFNIDINAKYKAWEGWSGWSGFDFYSKPNRQGDLVSFPIFGFIRGSQERKLMETMDHTTQSGRYWSNQCNNSNKSVEYYAYALKFTKQSIEINTCLTHTHAYCIKAIKY